MSDVKLTFAERAILANQFQILEKVDQSHAVDYEQAREIVEKGYEFLYETINAAISTASVPHESSEEVYNILDMFRAAELSASRAGTTSEELSLAFEGFDGNNEDHHFGFAYFVRRRQGKWSELSRHPDNSHAVMLPRYRQMLEMWHSFGKPHEMSEEQLELLAAKR
ncbi:YfbU family protein [Rhizobium tubonense]|uniref:YfbU family protein n=1 Tax=Rhizobium tubonense TaxID=484088 RepID=UPI0018A8619D|nr:YfbU family protein [Rhizobium tubonense]